MDIRLYVGLYDNKDRIAVVQARGEKSRLRWVSLQLMAFQCVD